VQASLTVSSSGSRCRHHGLYCSRPELPVGWVQKAHCTHRCVTTCHRQSSCTEVWRLLIPAHLTRSGSQLPLLLPRSDARQVRGQEAAVCRSSECMALAELKTGVLPLSCCTATAEPGGQPHRRSGHAAAQSAFGSRHLLRWQAAARQPGTEGRLPARTLPVCTAKSAWTMWPFTGSMLASPGAFFIVPSICQPIVPRTCHHGR
jgi:hypothetical protein